MGFYLTPNKTHMHHQHNENLKSEVQFVNRKHKNKGATRTLSLRLESEHLNHRFGGGT
jgi:hypothetical protein